MNFRPRLSNIGFATSLIRKKQQNESIEKLEEYTGIILNEKEKMRKHVEEILRLSSMENELEIKLDSIDSHEMLIKTAERFIHKIKGAGRFTNHFVKGAAFRFQRQSLSFVECNCKPIG